MVIVQSRLSSLTGNFAVAWPAPSVVVVRAAVGESGPAKSAKTVTVSFGRRARARYIDTAATCGAGLPVNTTTPRALRLRAAPSRARAVGVTASYRRRLAPNWVTRPLLPPPHLLNLSPYHSSIRTRRH